MIRGGLRDFSVSRTSLTWGIPLPWDSKHVAYVWFDALANYLTAVGYGSDNERFEKWWPAHHLIGKDIIRHHCVYWPAMLLSAGIEPPAGWAVGGWLLSGGEKMSKTTGNVVNPLEYADRYGADTVRMYTLFMGPADEDMDWQDNGLEGIWRFLNRLWRIAHEQAAVPAGEPGTGALARKTHQTIAKVTDDIDRRFSFHTASATVAR